MLKERIVFVGVGQCGNNIVREFEELGFNAFYINTSSEDLQQIDTDISLKYSVPNSGGCAKDRALAQNYTGKYFNEMMGTIDSRFPTSDVVFVVYSLGGGTGGGTSNMLLDIMTSEHEEKTYNAIAVLPDKHETMLIQKNAFDSLKELSELENINSIFLLDNDKVTDKMDINIQIATLFDNIVNANNSDKKGCFDRVEIERSLTEKGFSVIVETETNDNPKMAVAKSVEESIFATWINDCKTLGYTINARNRKEEIELKEALNSEFGTPYVDFTGFNPNSDTNIVIASGMSFNSSILSTLAERFNKLMEKKKQETSEIKTEEIVLQDISFGTKSSKPTKPVAKKEDKKKKLSDILAKYNK